MLGDAMDEYYEILGIAPGASKDEIKKAYRQMVKVWHPDRFPNDPELQRKGTEKVKQINEAYERLKDAPSHPRGSSRSQHGEHRTSGRGRKSDSSETSKLADPPTSNSFYRMFFGFVLFVCVAPFLPGLITQVHIIDTQDTQTHASSANTGDSSTTPEYSHPKYSQDLCTEISARKRLGLSGTRDYPERALTKDEQNRCDAYNKAVANCFEQAGFPQEEQNLCLKMSLGFSERT